MLHRLDDQRRFPGRIDAERGELGEVGRLAVMGDDDDLDVVDPQQRGEPIIAPGAAGHRAVADEMAVGQRHDMGVEIERPAAHRWINLAAELDPAAIADADRLGGQRRLGITDRMEADILQLRRQHGAQQTGGVTIGAGAGIVRVVRDYQRLVAGLARIDLTGLGAGDRFDQRREMDRGEAALLPGIVHQLFGDVLSLAAIIGRDRYRGADIVDVRRGESGLDADDQRIAGGFQRIATAQQFEEGRRGGAAAIERVEDGAPGERDLGLDLALHRALQQFGRLPSPLVLVDMGIGPVGDQRIGVVGHQLCHRRMQIEHHDDRNIGSDALAQARQQLALAVIRAFRRHRTVEMQQHAVDARGGIDDLAGEEVEGGIGDAAGRVGAGHQRMDEAPTELVGRLEGRPHRGPRAAEGTGDLVVAIGAVGPEGSLVRELNTEGVRLMHEFGYQHPPRHRLSAPAQFF